MKTKIQRNTIECPVCKKPRSIEKEVKNPAFYILTLDCKHTIIEPNLKRVVTEGRDSKFNEFFPYQREGIEFAEESNFNCLIGDEMGLGKTVQAAGILRYNLDNLAPVLIVVPPGLVYNWQKEISAWIKDRFTSFEDIPIVHRNSSGELMDGQRIHIVPSSLLSGEILSESIKNYGFKTLIVDEAQYFKNDASNRTVSLLDLARNIPHKILLSGTPIMNRIGEYFNILNMIKPGHWPAKKSLWEYCQWVDSRPIAIASWRKNDFFEKISSYVIRREKKDVLKDLPELRVNFTYLDLNASKGLITNYNKTLERLEETLNSPSRGQAIEILAIMSELRHMVGLAKVKPALSLILEWLENTEPEEQITIGCQHIAVMDALEECLAEYKPLRIDNQDPKVKDKIQEEFRLGKSRVLIASIIGAGTGRNLQFCQNAIILERQWNSTIEEQFKGRFVRPVKCIADGRLIVKISEVHYECPLCKERTEIGHVSVDYFQAKNTIDEFFHEMVELKKQTVSSVTDKNYEADENFIKDLARSVVAKRMKYVS